MIEISGVTVEAGRFSLRQISFSVPSGRYGVLMGKTGCGKTTLLEAIIGLRRATAGSIRLNGREVARLKPALRGIGYVPQDGALFSTMTVRDHLAFALEIRHHAAREVNARVDEMADLLGIRPLLPRKPQGLSGGERQRVALGRALSFRPDVLLLDEPLSAVDEDTRKDMYDLLRRVQRETGVTALHVTHSMQEAEELADCIFELKDGAVSVRQGPCV
jgi:ABC-type sugar transport system ATPase subunit